jgi:hypothetical protein
MSLPAAAVHIKHTLMHAGGAVWSAAAASDSTDAAAGILQQPLCLCEPYALCANSFATRAEAACCMHVSNFEKSGPHCIRLLLQLPQLLADIPDRSVVLLQPLTLTSTICVCSFASCAGSSSSMSNVRYLGLCSTPPDTWNKLQYSAIQPASAAAAAAEVRHSGMGAAARRLIPCRHLDWSEIISLIG